MLDAANGRCDVGCCSAPENEAKVVTLVDAVVDVCGIAESEAKQPARHLIWQDAEQGLNQRVAGRPALTKNLKHERERNKRTLCTLRTLSMGRPGSWTVQVDGAEEPEQAPGRLEKVLVDPARADVTADGFTVEWGADIDGCDVLV